MLYKIVIIVFFIYSYSSITAQSSFNKALKLNGINQYLEIPNMDYLNIDGKNDFTLEIRFKPFLLQPAVLLSKFDINIMGFMGSGFIFEVHKKENLNEFKIPEIFDGHYSATFVRYTRIFHDGQYGKYNGTAIRDTLNWNHYTISRSATLLKNYNDYDMMNDQVFRQVIGNNPKDLSSNSPLYIGGYPPSDSIDGNFIFYNGFIDEIRIWNRFIEKENILSAATDTLDFNYYNTKDSGLVAYYRFDKIEELSLSDGTTYEHCIRDLTPNKNHAKIINGGELVNHNDLTLINNEEKSLNTEFSLAQNYPNPFNPTTTISYYIPKTSNVTIKIYDSLGKELKTLINEEKPAGNFSLEFNAEKLASGIYFYQIITSEFVLTKKMVLMK